jgi:hypothetical protein
MKTNRKNKMVPIDLASEVTRILWPRFVEAYGLVFLDLSGRRRANNKPFGYRRRLEPGLDKTGIESFQNHTHILDLFKHDRIMKHRSLDYDQRHPHFRLAERIGVAVAEAWCAKLKRDFPQDNFRVYYTPNRFGSIVRFHRLYPNETAWFPDDGKHPPSFGQIRIWDTSRTR